MDKDCLDPEELPEKMYPKQIILTEDNKLFVSVRVPHIVDGDDDNPFNEKFPIEKNRIMYGDYDIGYEYK
jgi:hypothetical protein